MSSVAKYQDNLENENEFEDKSLGGERVEVPKNKNKITDKKKWNK